MYRLTFINGAMVSATDVRKHWSRIVQSVKNNHKPVFVYTNNTPEAVVQRWSHMFEQLKAYL